MKNLVSLYFFLILLKFNAQNSLMLFTSDSKLMQVKIADTVVNKSFQAQVEIHKLIEDTVTISVEFTDKTKITQRIFLMLKRQPTVNEAYVYKFNPTSKKFEFFNHSQAERLPQPIVPPKPIEDTTFKYRNKTLEHFCEIKDDKPVFYNNIPHKKKCAQPMPTSYLSYVKLLMAKCETPDAKKKLSESIMRNNCLSVEQAIALISYSEYEVEKIKLFKLAYQTIIDKENAPKFKSTLTYQSSKNEFDNYLKEVNSNTLTVISDCVKPSKNEEIQEFVTVLKAALNDASRLDIFKKKYNDYCYTVEHTIQILLTFIHDREKLEVAQSIYFRSTEKSNYQKINSVFSYKQSESEMIDFIEKQN